MRLRLASSVAVSCLVALAVVVSACSNEGEGEPCSQQNGNNDCNDGLVCVPPVNPRATNAPSVCCPAPPAQGTQPACIEPGTGVDGSTSAPPDASTFPEGSADGRGGEASSDAPSEAASDAQDGAPASGAADGSAD